MRARKAALSRRGVVAGLVLLAVAGCAGGGPATGTRALVRSELFFGRLKPDGVVVTEGEWGAFVAEEITPRFPDGFTVVDALGQYRTRAGVILTEPTKILVIVHGGDPAARAAIQELRDLYRRRFGQESVLLVESPVRGAF